MNVADERLIAALDVPTRAAAEHILREMEEA